MSLPYWFQFALTVLEEYTFYQHRGQHQVKVDGLHQTEWPREVLEGWLGVATPLQIPFFPPKFLELQQAPDPQSLFIHMPHVLSKSKDIMFLFYMCVVVFFQWIFKGKKKKCHTSLR